MLKPISLVSISIHHLLASYWPYLTQHFDPKKKLPLLILNLNSDSQTLINKINIIYENSMIGLMIGLSFFHLMPISNTQIHLFLYQSSRPHYKPFPYGTMTAILTFVFVLGNSNYFYHKNSTKNSFKRQNFRSRAEFEHEMLSNKKLKIRRRLAIQSLPTQLMISLPSILLTSVLASNNDTEIWFWCMVTIMFEKQHICSYFGRSYLASGVEKYEAMKLIVCHLGISLIYMIGCMLIVWLYPIMNGILNGMSCGIIMYDVMIQKLAQNYEQKDQLFQKLLFFVCGVFLSTLIISN